MWGWKVYLYFMALINCPECNKEVSDRATSCPRCGCHISQQLVQQEEYLCCPFCSSRELHAEHKGFSGGKALAGVMPAGGVGLLAGTIGSHDTQITCLKCGKKIQAGEARIVKKQVLGDEEIIDIVNNHGVIQAAMLYKEQYNYEIPEAIKYIDSIFEKHNITPLPSTQIKSETSNKGCMLPILITIASTVSLLFFV